MSGFSLGGSDGGSYSHRGNDDEEEEGISPESLFLYGASNIAVAASSAIRRFELWQHQQMERHHQHQFYSATPTMLCFSSDDQPHH